MNRKIKFRGKTKVDFGNGNKEILIPKGTWIYGGIVFDDSERIWIDMKYYGQILVDENTVGQDTGLDDKNGVEIYDGDVLNFDDEYWIVSYEYGKFIGTFDNVSVDLYDISDYEIVDNIYDNPELLGGKNGI
jgi:uncharacterized phage protein (TIGR01671 family)